jgi:hypothetical protein
MLGSVSPPLVTGAAARAGGGRVAPHRERATDEVAG